MPRLTRAEATALTTGRPGSLLPVRRPKSRPSGSQLRTRGIARKGIRAERRARAALEQMGYVVARSAGSRGAFDLCALRGPEVLLIQVKAGKPRSRPEVLYRVDLDRLTALDVVAKRELWLWVDGQGWLISAWDGAWRPGQAWVQTAGASVIRGTPAS